MIRAVAFDFGNVLSAFSHARGCRQIAALAGPTVTESQVHQWLYAGDRFYQLEMGRLAPDQFLAELGRAFQVDDLAALRRAYQQIFNRLPSSCELIARVRLPKFLASNTDPLHWEEIERHFANDFAGFVPGGCCARSRPGIASRLRGSSPACLTGFARVWELPNCHPRKCCLWTIYPKTVKRAASVGLRSTFIRIMT